MQGADENVPWEEGLEVDEGEGVGCCMKDLSLCVRFRLCEIGGLHRGF